MSERNGEGETHRLNDRIREQGKRGSPSSKMGYEKKSKSKTQSKRVNVTTCLVLYFYTHSMHLPPTNTMMPHYGSAAERQYPGPNKSSGGTQRAVPAG